MCPLWEMQHCPLLRIFTKQCSVHISEKLYHCILDVVQKLSLFASSHNLPLIDLCKSFLVYLRMLMVKHDLFAAGQGSLLTYNINEWKAKAINVLTFALHLHAGMGSLGSQAEYAVNIKLLLYHIKIQFFHGVYLLRRCILGWISGKHFLKPIFWLVITLVSFGRLLCTLCIYILCAHITAVNKCE